ncbi:MAG: pyruvate kinase [Candidatus Microgenomates bacterium]
MMKLTKIIATIGPSSEDEKIIEKLILNGVNVFRFNFKHNTIDWHSQMIKKVNNVALKLNQHIGTLIDLQGPEIRLYFLKNQEKIELKKGTMLLLDDDVKLSHQHVKSKLKNNQKILVDDGYFVFKVILKNNQVYLHSETQGVLKDRKTVTIPGVDFEISSLIKRDFEGIKLAALNEVDFIALSYVREKQDINDLKKELKKYKFTPKIIAKIETKKAIENIDEIIESCDGVMVARGDMAVEIAWEVVPYFQKMIIKKALLAGKFVITATQMLESMINHPTPTRAEVSDVANAFYDGTDAVMLSAESASGQYPVETVSIMAKTLKFNEDMVFKENKEFFQPNQPDWTTLICKSAFKMYQYFKDTNEDIIGFLVLTETGRTAMTLSRFRPGLPIFSVCQDKKIADFLSIGFGIYPTVFKFGKNGLVDKNILDKIIEFLKEKYQFKNNQKLIVLHGDYRGKIGGTSTVRLVKI